MPKNQDSPEKDDGDKTKKKISSVENLGEDSQTKSLPNDSGDHEEDEKKEGLVKEEEILRQEAELFEDFAKPADSEGDSDMEIDSDYAMTRKPEPISLEEIRAMEAAPEGAAEDEVAKRSIMEASMTDYELDELEYENLEGPPPDDRGLGASFAVTEEEIDALPREPQEPLPVPPPSAMRGAPLFSEAAFLAPGPTTGSESEDAPELSGDLAPTKELLDTFVTEERMSGLWARADTAQKVINEKIFNIDLARQLLDQIRSAKTLMLADRSNYEEAERALNEVEFRIAYSERTKRWSDSLAFKILIYEVVWLIVFIAIFLILVIRGGFDLAITTSDLITPVDVYNALGGMLTGGVGGVIGALYALWRYVSNDEFNAQYRIWYYAQPIMGIPIGAFIFLFLQIGFNIAAGSSQTTIQSPFMIYLLALIAGFQQNVVYDIVRQVLKLFKIGEDRDRMPSEIGEEPEEQE